MTEPGTAQPHIEVTQDDTMELYEIGGDAHLVGQTIRTLTGDNQFLATVIWREATVDSVRHEIVVEGARPDHPCRLTIRVAHTRANTATDCLNGTRLIACTAATIACLGFGNGEDDMARYWHVLGRLIEDTRDSHTFGGLMDRRTL